MSTTDSDQIRTVLSPSEQHRTKPEPSGFRQAIDMTWAGFCGFLHETPDSDANKITLLAVVVRSAGQPDRPIDIEDLMVLLKRSKDTVRQALDVLAQGPSPWVRRGADLSPGGRPMVAWFTTKRIDG